MQMTPSEPPPPPPPPPPPSTAGPRNPFAFLRRRRPLIAVIAIVAVLTGTLAAVLLVTRPGGGPSEARSSSPSPGSRPPSRPTVPEQIMLDHTDTEGRIDVGGALELFSYAFTPLPGVTLPPGPADRPANWTDTALDAMLTNWSELTLDERRVVLSYLGTSTKSSGSPSPAGATGTASAAAAPSLATGAPGPTTYQLDVATVAQQLQVKVQQALQDEAARLGHTLADVGITDPPPPSRRSRRTWNRTTATARPAPGRGGRAERGPSIPTRTTLPASSPGSRPLATSTFLPPFGTT